MSDEQSDAEYLRENAPKWSAHAAADAARIREIADRIEVASPAPEQPTGLIAKMQDKNEHLQRKVKALAEDWRRQGKLNQELLAKVAVLERQVEAAKVLRERLQRHWDGAVRAGYTISYCAIADFDDAMKAADAAAPPVDSAEQKEPRA